MCTSASLVLTVPVHESVPTSQDCAAKQFQQASMLALDWVCSNGVNPPREMACFSQGRLQPLHTPHCLIQSPLKHELLLAYQLLPPPMVSRQTWGMGSVWLVSRLKAGAWMFFCRSSISLTFYCSLVFCPSKPFFHTTNMADKDIQSHSSD